MAKPTSTGNKRMLGIQILDIISRCASKKKPLTQQQIIDKLNDEYQTSCTRSTLAAHIGNFQTQEFFDVFGGKVMCDRQGAGYYLDREFSDGELRLLIDSVISIRSLPADEADMLINKLIRHGTEPFQRRARSYTASDMKDLPHFPNPKVLANVTIISDAITEKHKVSFIYNDVALHSPKTIVLKPRSKERYTVNPYRLMLYGGWLYLLGNTEGHDNISTYRIDKMTEVQEEADPIKTWRDIDKFYNPPKTMAESLHMFSSDSTDIEFWIEEHCLKDLVDWFGWEKFKIISTQDGRHLIRLKCSRTAILFWALSYGQYVEITKPVDLREEMKQVGQEIYERHQ